MGRYAAATSPEHMPIRGRQLTETLRRLQTEYSMAVWRSASTSHSVASTGELALLPVARPVTGGPREQLNRTIQRRCGGEWHEEPLATPVEESTGWRTACSQYLHIRGESALILRVRWRDPQQYFWLATGRRHPRRSHSRTFR